VKNLQFSPSTMVALEADGSAARPLHPTLPPETPSTSLIDHRLMNLNTSLFRSATNQPNMASGRTPHVDPYFHSPPAMRSSMNSAHASHPPHATPSLHDFTTLLPSECIKFDAESTTHHAAWHNNPNSTCRQHVSSPPFFSTAGGDLASAAIPVKPLHSNPAPSRMDQKPPCFPTHLPTTHQFTTTTITHLTETTKTTKISTTSLHSPPDPSLISNGNQFFHWKPDPNTVCQSHTQFLQPARGRCMDFSTAVPPPKTPLYVNGSIYHDHQIISTDSPDSFSQSSPNKGQSSNTPEPSATAPRNPVPIDNPTIISLAILRQEDSTDSASPIEAPACLQFDGMCHPSTANSFRERLRQNELEFLATLAASQQMFEHNLQLARTAFEEQMARLKHMCTVVPMPPICISEQLNITSNGRHLSQPMLTMNNNSATGPSQLNTRSNTAAIGVPWFKSSFYVF